jgi:WD40 repeat protein
MAEDYLSDFRQEMLTTIKTRLEEKHNITVSMKAIITIVKLVVIFKIHEKLAPNKLNRLSIEWFEHYLDEKNSVDQQDQIYLNQKSHMRTMRRQINSIVAQSYKYDMASTIEDIVGLGFLEDYGKYESEEDGPRVAQQNALSFRFFMRAHVKLLESVIDGIKVCKLDHVHKIDTRGPGLRPEASAVILENKSAAPVQDLAKNLVAYLSEKSAMSMQLTVDHRKLFFYSSGDCNWKAWPMHDVNSLRPDKPFYTQENASKKNVMLMLIDHNDSYMYQFSSDCAMTVWDLEGLYPSVHRGHNTQPLAIRWAEIPDCSEKSGMHSEEFGIQWKSKTSFVSGAMDNKNKRLFFFIKDMECLSYIDLSKVNDQSTVRYENIVRLHHITRFAEPRILLDKTEKWMFLSSKKNLMVWNIEKIGKISTDAPHFNFGRAHETNITAKYISDGNQWLYTGSNDGSVKVWSIQDMNNLSDKEERYIEHIHDNRISNIRIDDTQSFLITSSDDKSLRFFRLGDLILHGTIEENSKNQNKFSAARRRVEDRKTFMDLGQVKPIYQIDNVHSLNIDSVLLEQDSLITSGKDQMIRIFNIRKLREDLKPKLKFHVKNIHKAMVLGIYQGSEKAVTNK